MKEEDNIKKKAGPDNPFTVPEGYFDNLTEKIMGQLPEKEELPESVEEPTTWAKIRPWLYMAAMFIAILLPIRFIVQHTTTDDAALATNDAETEAVIEDYIEYAIMDHTMMDDYTLYQFITEEDIEDYN